MFRKTIPLSRVCSGTWQKVQISAYIYFTDDLLQYMVKVEISVNSYILKIHIEIFLTFDIPM